MRRHRSLPRQRFFGPDAKDVALTCFAILFASAVATIVVLYPKGIASWDHGHLTISLDR